MKARIEQRQRPGKSARLVAVLGTGQVREIVGSDLPENRKALQRYVGKTGVDVKLMGDGVVIVDEKGAW